MCFRYYCFQYTKILHPQIRTASSFLLKSFVLKHQSILCNISGDYCYLEKNSLQGKLCTFVSSNYERQKSSFKCMATDVNLWWFHAYKDELECLVILFSLGAIWLICRLVMENRLEKLYKNHSFLHVIYRVDLATFKAVHCWHLAVFDTGIWERRVKSPFDRYFRLLS